MFTGRLDFQEMRPQSKKAWSENGYGKRQETGLEVEDSLRERGRGAQKKQGGTG